MTIKKSSSLFHALLGASLLVYGLTVRAAVLKVPENYPGLREAINAATNGDQISLAPGEYRVSDVIVHGKSITIAGRDTKRSTVLVGDQRYPVIRVRQALQAPVVFRDLTIKNGRAYASSDLGGGIAAEDTWLVVRNVAFEANDACYGGAIGAKNSAVEVSQSFFSRNGGGCTQATQGAAIFLKNNNVLSKTSVIKESFFINHAGRVTNVVGTSFQPSYGQVQTPLSLTVQNNVFRENTFEPSELSGAINLSAVMTAKILGNLFERNVVGGSHMRNTSYTASALGVLSAPYSVTDYSVVVSGNHFVDNQSGSATLVLKGSGIGVQIRNNVFQVGFSGFSSSQLNQYQYLYQAPIYTIDPRHLLVACDSTVRLVPKGHIATTNTFFIKEMSWLLASPTMSAQSELIFGCNL